MFIYIYYYSLRAVMAALKVDIYKIHPKNLHISGIKAILRDVFLKYLQARY